MGPTWVNMSIFRISPVNVNGENLFVVYDEGIELEFSSFEAAWRFLVESSEGRYIVWDSDEEPPEGIRWYNGPDGLTISMIYDEDY